MKIQEVSKQLDITQDTLRYYERVGLLTPVNRTPSGIRDYGEADLQRISFVKCMRSAGMPVEALVEYLNLCEQGDSTTAGRKAILTAQRDRLVTQVAELQRTLELLNYKISSYENMLLNQECKKA